MRAHDLQKVATRTRREEGSALLIVVLLMLVIVAVATPMLVMSNTTHQIAANERDAERALFAAKAGLNYGFYLYDQGTLVPTTGGATFNSYASSVATPLNGESFTGTMTDISALVGRGQLYKILSTGTFGKSNRQVEMIIEVSPESMKYGYLAFSAADLHNHSGLSGPSFKIESTIFSNGTVSVPQGLTIDGSIVAADAVSIDTGSTIKGNIFANSVTNKGAITGNVKRLDAMSELPSTAITYDRLDAQGNKWAWFAGNSTAGTFSGTAPAGTNTSYNVANGDAFNYTIFNRNGSLSATPDVNVVEYISPPLLDYKAMKTEADLNDATYFTTTTAAMTYLRGKIVTETIDGKTIKTIKVGTTSAPEFLYIKGDFPLVLTGGSGSNTGSSIAADGINLEGGLYASGDVSIDGPVYNAALQPPPPDWYQVRINALPYCYPAIIAYPEPSTGTIATWTPANTPTMTGSSSKISMSSGTGFFFWTGLTLSEGETHLHHTANANELIRFIGAELAYKIHNCDYMWFTYDPNVRCTKFLLSAAGTPEVVSYRELR
jgi:cytoskeletal protein CcmA (bactofilin family)